MHISDAYSPHMGYSKSDRAKYWKEISRALSATKKISVKTWRADNNTEKPIGKWKYSIEAGKVNGEIKENILKYNLTATNTIYTTLLTMKK